MDSSLGSGFKLKLRGGFGAPMEARECMSERERRREGEGERERIVGEGGLGTTYISACKCVQDSI